MRYDITENRIYLSDEELVITAYRGISPLLPTDDRMPAPSGTAGSSRLDFSSGGYDFALLAGAGTYETIIRGKKPTREERACAEGIAYVRALAENPDADDHDTTLISVRYVSEKSGEIECYESETTAKKLRSFFEKCKSHLPSYARAEIERVTVRLPSLAAIKFPYEKPRAAQSEFIRSAYRAISRGVDLLAEAPTGTGKTVSAIFPALRAIGDGRVNKAFYLTPKATTANAASACVKTLCENGARIRATILYSKERICNQRLVCRDGAALCPGLSQNKITAATLALFDKNLPVCEKEDILAVAEEFGVCPHELGLCYSELCDLVILDVNYLFDPRVYIRRYFSSHGEYAFLIDEAHNLQDRVREAFSAEISEADVKEASSSEQLGELCRLKEASAEAARAMHELLFPYIKDELYTDKNGEEHGAYHTSRLPEGLTDIFEKLSAITEEELRAAIFAKDEEAPLRAKFLRAFSYKINGFLSALERFDESYELFAFFDAGEIRTKIFCLDTGNIIRERTALGKSTVFFSATLSPMEYYRSTLGLDRSGGAISLESPFSEDQMRVIVMNKISTRSSERERTLGAVCRVISATLSSRRGNYIIFSPSYAYSEALYNFFRAKHPKIKAILQTPSMSDEARAQFLSNFTEDDRSYLVAFCVMGSIYSEGIDLAGNKLIGTVVVGIGSPALSFEREAIAAYYEEKMDAGKQYAYIYPGINKVLQAAGRVIRTEDDRGVIVLVDDRFDDPIYKKTAPKVFRGMRFISDARELKEELDEFWLLTDAEERE